MTRNRHPEEYLADIRSAASKAITFLGSMSQAEFEADEKTAFAVIRALEIVGEAAKCIPPDVRQRFPNIPWRAMHGHRI